MTMTDIKFAGTPRTEEELAEKILTTLYSLLASQYGAELEGITITKKEKNAG